MEIRKKLSDSQRKILLDVSEKVQRATVTLQDQREKAEIAQTLIFEHLGVPQGNDRVRFDEQTHELVFEVADSATPPARASTSHAVEEVRLGIPE